MAADWITLPIEQLVRSRSHGALRADQCALCGMNTVPSTEQTAAEQIRIHLERHHEAVAETATNRTSARLRKKLTRMGWTPPVDDEPGPPGPPESPAETPREGRP